VTKLIHLNKNWD